MFIVSKCSRAVGSLKFLWFAVGKTFMYSPSQPSTVENVEVVKVKYSVIFFFCNLVKKDSNDVLTS